MWSGLLVLAIGQAADGGRLVEEGEAAPLEEAAAVDRPQDRHPEAGDRAADEGLLAAPAGARPGADGTHPADDDAALNHDPVVAREHGLRVGRRAADRHDVDALGAERGGHRVVLGLHLREVGGAVATPVPLGLVVDQGLDRRIVPVGAHDPDLVARPVHEDRPQRSHVVVDAPAATPDPLLHLGALEGGEGSGRNPLQHLVVVLPGIPEAHGDPPREPYIARPSGTVNHARSGRRDCLPVRARGTIVPAADEASRPTRASRDRTGPRQRSRP